jgi:subtilisin family serine protease
VTWGCRAAQQWSRGEGVRIAVVDTGVDTVHPDFRGRLGRVRDFVADGRSAAETHGTAVAGIIAAVPDNGIGIAGIAPDATVISLRACWSASGALGACNSFTLAQALAAAAGAQAGIVNLSLGGPPDALLTRIVERLLARGVVVVGAVPPSGRREGFPDRPSRASLPWMPVHAGRLRTACCTHPAARCSPSHRRAATTSRQAVRWRRPKSRAWRRCCWPRGRS